MPTILLLRHTIAVVAYRGEKALRDAPDGFSDFRPGASSRSAGEVLAHICDLFDWALALANGKHVWAPVAPRSWAEDSERFFAALEAFDARLARPEPTGFPESVLFQGPIADALQHIGQLTMMRRLAGGPVVAENYARAEIAIGNLRPPFGGKRVEF